MKLATFVVFVVSAVFLAAPATAQEYDCVRVETDDGYRLDCVEVDPTTGQLVAPEPVAPLPPPEPECVRTETPQGYRLDCTDQTTRLPPSEPECVRTETPQGYRLDCTDQTTRQSVPRPVARQSATRQSVAQPGMGIVLGGGLAPVAACVDASCFYGGRTFQSNVRVEGRVEDLIGSRIAPYGGVTFMQGGGRPAVSGGLQRLVSSPDSTLRFGLRVGLWYLGTVFPTGGVNIEVGGNAGAQVTMDWGARNSQGYTFLHYGAYFRF